MRITIPVSSAELLDKIAILEVKEQKITDPQKLENVRKELAALREVCERDIVFTEELEGLFQKIREISRAGWEIEDVKRACEAKRDFGERFITAGRDAFKNNDLRASIWKEINILLKSDIVQEKSYQKY